ncbi:MAG: glycosyltransferase [Candidatus Rokubacteria bacterium]|nr:glycosyltransferase [Candidatus Rokubacteria bacterium]
MSLRVAHVLDSLNLGGTETQGVALVRALAARGIENRLVHFQTGPLREQLDVPNVVVDRLDCGSFLRPATVRLVRRLARDLRAFRADVVQTYGFYTNLPGLLAGRLAGVPVLVASRRGHAINLTPAQRRVDRLVRRLAHVTVVNAEALRRTLQEEEGPRPVAVIPNCVLERGPVVPLDRVTESGPVVGMVANFRAPKDHRTFLRAARLVVEKVPTAEFRMIGRGPEEPAMRELAAHLELGARVRFLGALAPEAVWAAVNRFTVSVLASHSEGMPNAVLEAMLAGRPVVATAVGGVPEVVEDGVTGYLVRPRDASALAAPIARLLKDPAIAVRMGAAARERARTRHGVDAMVESFLSLWRSFGAGERAA